MSNIIMINNDKYRRCVDCKRLLNVTTVKSDVHICKKCRHFRYRKISPLTRLTVTEQREEVKTLFNYVFRKYFKTMEKEYEIKNKR